MLETQRKCRRSRRWIREQWRRHVAAQASSGLSGVAYCHRHGLHAKSLYRWRRVFGVGMAAPGSVEHEATRPVFAEVRIRDAAEVPEHRAPEGCARLEVVAQGGRAIRVWPGFDGETLARAVAVLEGLCTPEVRSC
jgi:transposase-like protein